MLVYLENLDFLARLMTLHARIAYRLITSTSYEVFLLDDKKRVDDQPHQRCLTKKIAPIAKSNVA